MPNDIEEITGSSEEAIDRVEDLGKSIEDLAKNSKDPLQFVVNKFKSMGGEAAIAAGFVAALGIAISQANQSAEKFVDTMLSIKGINGDVSELADTFTRLGKGVVSKQDLATFFQMTDTLYASADAMKSQAGFARDLIAAYGNVQNAANKYRSILMLSADSQEKMTEYVRQMAEAYESTPTGKIEKIKNDFQEMFHSIGSSMLMMLEPLMTFLSAVSEALRRISGEQKTVLTDAEYMQKMQALAEEYGTTLEELNEIERGGFTSSLDEVHTADMGAISGEDSVLGTNEDEIDRVSAGVEEYTDLIDTLVIIFGDLKEVGKEIWEIFQSLFTSEGLWDFVEGILSVVSAMVKFLDKTGLLEGALWAVFGVMVAMKALKFASFIADLITKFSGMTVASKTAANAQTELSAKQVAATGTATAEAAAQGALAASAMAAAGASTYGIAVPIIIGAVLAGVAALAAAGIYSGSGGSASVPTVEQPDLTNGYGGTAKESGQPSVSVYLDGRKVNDELARSDYYNEEVRIS